MAETMKSLYLIGQKILMKKHQKSGLLKAPVALVLLAVFSVSFVTIASNKSLTHQDMMSALDGEWIYVEDRTEGRSLEQLGPPMSSKFSFRIEKDAVVLVQGHGSGHRDVRISLDRSVTEVVEKTKITRYHGAWNDTVFFYEVDFMRESGIDPNSRIRREFRITTDGLLVSFTHGSPAGSKSVGLYRHAEDIAMPMPVKALITDMGWLAGAWAGTRGAGGTTSIEERWSPPLGGSMLGVSRRVSRGKMTAFEFLRIVERDSGLLYIAQPGGVLPTEFVLTELNSSRAVFENPRHDYPKRIVYELSPEGSLRATIGFSRGGTPQRLDFNREGGSGF
jgi:hypothetical protein